MCQDRIIWNLLRNEPLQTIDRIRRCLFDCHPRTALCFVPGGSIAAISLDHFAPQTTPYRALVNCLSLPTMIWPGVIADGIESRPGVRERRKSKLIWKLIGCLILISPVPLPPLQDTADAFRFTTAYGLLGWLPLLLGACVSVIATRVLIGAEKAWHTVTTGPIGTFVQFVCLPVCVCFLHSRAQRLARSNT